MNRPKNKAVAYRNVRLVMDTYRMLDQYLIELMQKKGDRRLTLDDAVKSLLTKHNPRKGVK